MNIRIARFDMRFRLFVLGIISQPFYVMALGNHWTDFNILFLFSIAVLGISGIKAKYYGSQFWAPAMCIIVLQYIHVDYSLNGFLFILVLYAARHTKSGLAAAFLAVAAFWGLNQFSPSIRYSACRFRLWLIPP